MLVDPAVAARSAAEKRRIVSKGYVLCKLVAAENLIETEG